MRTHCLLFASAAAVFFTWNEAGAQFYPPGSYSSAYWTRVYPYPAVYGYAAFRSPFGYQTGARYVSYPTFYGPATYYQTRTRIQPYYVGPYHSIYFQPFQNAYRYVPGYWNMPAVESFTWTNPYYGP